MNWISTEYTLLAYSRKINTQEFTFDFKSHSPISFCRNLCEWGDIDVTLVEKNAPMLEVYYFSSSAS